MKQAMINYVQNPKNDELYTPIYAIEPLVEFISPETIIWECTDFGGSKITELFRSRGNTVITSHLNTGQSFFDYEPDNYDMIVTNPPYSLKNEFLQRCFELDKPFALLLPLTALEGEARGKMFRKYGIDVLILDKRVNFMENKNNVWFNTSWFTKYILPDSLVFKQI